MPRVKVRKHVPVVDAGAQVTNYLPIVDAQKQGPLVEVAKKLWCSCLDSGVGLSHEQRIERIDRDTHYLYTFCKTNLRSKREYFTPVRQTKEG